MPTPNWSPGYISNHLHNVKRYNFQLSRTTDTFFPQKASYKQGLMMVAILHFNWLAIGLILIAFAYCRRICFKPVGSISRTLRACTFICVVSLTLTLVLQLLLHAVVIRTLPVLSLHPADNGEIRGFMQRIEKKTQHIARELFDPYYGKAEGYGKSGVFAHKKMYPLIGATQKLVRSYRNPLWTRPIPTPLMNLMRRTEWTYFFLFTTIWCLAILIVSLLAAMKKYLVSAIFGLVFCCIGAILVTVIAVAIADACHDPRHAISQLYSDSVKAVESHSIKMWYMHVCREWYAGFKIQLEQYTKKFLHAYLELADQANSEYYHNQWLFLYQMSDRVRNVSRDEVSELHRVLPPRCDFDFMKPDSWKNESHTQAPKYTTPSVSPEAPEPFENPESIPPGDTSETPRYANSENASPGDNSDASPSKKSKHTPPSDNSEGPPAQHFENAPPSDNYIVISEAPQPSEISEYFSPVDKSEGLSRGKYLEKASFGDKIKTSLSGINPENDSSGNFSEVPISNKIKNVPPGDSLKTVPPGQNPESAPPVGHLLPRLHSPALFPNYLVSSPSKVKANIALDKSHRRAFTFKTNKKKAVRKKNTSKHIEALKLKKFTKNKPKKMKKIKNTRKTLRKMSNYPFKMILPKKMTRTRSIKRITKSTFKKISRTKLLKTTIGRFKNTRTSKIKRTRRTTKSKTILHMRGKREIHIPNKIDTPLSTWWKWFWGASNFSNPAITQVSIMSPRSSWWNWFWSHNNVSFTINNNASQQTTTKPTIIYQLPQSELPSSEGSRSTWWSWFWIDNVASFNAIEKPTPSETKTTMSWLVKESNIESSNISNEVMIYKNPKTDSIASWWDWYWRVNNKSAPHDTSIQPFRRPLEQKMYSSESFWNWLFSSYNNPNEYNDKKQLRLMIFGMFWPPVVVKITTLRPPMTPQPVYTDNPAQPHFLPEYDVTMRGLCASDRKLQIIVAQAFVLFMAGILCILSLIIGILRLKRSSKCPAGPCSKSNICKPTIKAVPRKALARCPDNPWTIYRRKKCPNQCQKKCIVLKRLQCQQRKDLMRPPCEHLNYTCLRKKRNNPCSLCKKYKYCKKFIPCTPAMSSPRRKPCRSHKRCMKKPCRLNKNRCLKNKLCPISIACQDFLPGLTSTVCAPRPPKKQPCKKRLLKRNRCKEMLTCTVSKPCLCTPNCSNSSPCLKNIPIPYPVPHIFPYPFPYPTFLPCTLSSPCLKPSPFTGVSPCTVDSPCLGVSHPVNIHSGMSPCTPTTPCLRSSLYPGGLTCTLDMPCLSGFPFATLKPHTGAKYSLDPFLCSEMFSCKRKRCSKYRPCLRKPSCTYYKPCLKRIRRRDILPCSISNPCLQNMFCSIIKPCLNIMNFPMDLRNSHISPTNVTSTIPLPGAKPCVGSIPVSNRVPCKVSNPCLYPSPCPGIKSCTSARPCLGKISYPKYTPCLARCCLKPVSCTANQPCLRQSPCLGSMPCTETRPCLGTLLCPKLKPCKRSKCRKPKKTSTGVLCTRSKPCLTSSPCPGVDPCTVVKPCLGSLSTMKPCKKSKKCIKKVPCSGKIPCAALSRVAITPTSPGELPCSLSNPCLKLSPCLDIPPCTASNPCLGTFLCSTSTPCLQTANCSQRKPCLGVKPSQVSISGQEIIPCTLSNPCLVSSCKITNPCLGLRVCPNYTPCFSEFCFQIVPCSKEKPCLRQSPCLGSLPCSLTRPCLGTLLCPKLRPCVVSKPKSKCKRIRSGKKKYFNESSLCGILPSQASPSEIPPCQESPCQKTPCQKPPCQRPPCQQLPCQMPPCQKQSCQKSPCQIPPCKLSPCHIPPPQQSLCQKPLCQLSPCQKQPCQESACMRPPCQTSLCQNLPCQESTCQEQSEPLHQESIVYFQPTKQKPVKLKNYDSERHYLRTQNEDVPHQKPRSLKLPNQNLPYQESLYQELPYQESSYQDSQYQESLSHKQLYQVLSFQKPPYQNSSYQEPLNQEVLYQEPPFQDSTNKEPQYQKPLYQRPHCQNSPYQRQPCKESPCQRSPCQKTSSQMLLFQESPCQKPPCQESPCQKPPCQESPYQKSPCKKPPCQESPCQESPCQELPCQESPCQESPCQESPCQESPCQESPCQESPCQESPCQESPCQESPCQESLYQESSCQESPCQESPSKRPPCQESLFEKAPCRKSTCQRQPCQESPCQKPPCQKPPCQKPSCQKPPCQKPPCQKPPCQKPPCQKPPCQKPPCQKPLCQKPPCQKPPCQKPPCQKPPCQNVLCHRPPCQESPCQKSPCQESPCQESTCQESPCQESPCQKPSCLESSCQRPLCQEPPCQKPPCQKLPCQNLPCQKPQCQKSVFLRPPCQESPYQESPCQESPFQEPPCQRPPCQNTPYQRLSCKKSAYQRPPFQESPCQVSPCQDPSCQSHLVSCPKNGSFSKIKRRSKSYTYIDYVPSKDSTETSESSKFRDCKKRTRFSPIICSNVKKSVSNSNTLCRKKSSNKCCKITEPCQKPKPCLKNPCKRRKKDPITPTVYLKPNHLKTSRVCEGKNEILCSGNDIKPRESRNSRLRWNLPEITESKNNTCTQPQPNLFTKASCNDIGFCSPKYCLKNKPCPAKHQKKTCCSKLNRVSTLPLDPRSIYSSFNEKPQLHAGQQNTFSRPISYPKTILKDTQYRYKDTKNQQIYNPLGRYRAYQGFNEDNQEFLPYRRFDPKMSRDKRDTFSEREDTRDTRNSRRRYQPTYYLPPCNTTALPNVPRHSDSLLSPKPLYYQQPMQYTAIIPKVRSDPSTKTNQQHFLTVPDSDAMAPMDRTDEPNTFISPSTNSNPTKYLNFNIIRLIKNKLLFKLYYKTVPNPRINILKFGQKAFRGLQTKVHLVAGAGSKVYYKSKLLHPSSQKPKSKLKILHIRGYKQKLSYVNPRSMRVNKLLSSRALRTKKLDTTCKTPR